MSNKQKHLEFIQKIINRMAGNLFFLKGWTITLITALFVLFVKDTNSNYIFVIYFPVIIFWILDGYFLSQERLFRALYDYVRKLDEKEIDFSMNTKEYKKDKRNCWLYSMFSVTLLCFYLSLIAITLLITYLIN
ncbi:MAG: hypothetical protein ACTSQY_09115 [Candidatus Odinarchaeia archaeon]